jgi:hypothetical protein
VLGSQPEDRVIVINGKGFLVTENCQTMLWRLWQPDRSVYVWIDAICIYQAMEREKDKQLTMMDDIYSTADYVIAYLGEASADSKLAVDFAKDLLNKLWPLRNKRDLKIKEETLQAFDLPQITNPGWQALRNLLNRPRFYRKWIIQEYALAKEVHCMLEDTQVSFETLTLVHQLCIQLGLDEIFDGSCSSFITIRKTHPLNVLIAIRSLIRRNFDDDSHAPTKKLTWLLGATSYAKVGKHRHDHIYVLRGMNKVSGELAGLPYPVINYNHSVVDVFIDYACIEDWTDSGSEASLLELGSQPKWLSLPSWVPDWSHPTSLEYIMYPGPSHAYSASPEKDRSSFKFYRRTQTLSCAHLYSILSMVQVLTMMNIILLVAR